MPLLLLLSPETRPICSKYIFVFEFVLEKMCIVLYQYILIHLNGTGVICLIVS